MPRLITFACLAALFVVGPLSARPAHKQALAQYFGSHLPRTLHDCRTCHLPDRVGQPKEEADFEKPHNSFGKRLAAVKGELRKAGKSTTVDARLEAILEEDSDGDGVSNLLELLAGRFPGDPGDRPTEAESLKATVARVGFLQERKGYAWRPFDPVKRSSVPSVKNVGQVRNPIDAFIVAEHETLGLKARPEASRTVLLRRVYLDLIGLPPTPVELQSYFQDTSPGAFDKVVDKLLASPQYGERWGRHWMDIWRYSDWAGYGPQIRDSQPHVWRWRDWIVDSLNDDKPYDRMVLEMLAGDELAPEDPKALAATGYLVRNYKLLSREKWMQDTVEHTFMAFQGLTIGCARCHDHMYDPLLQAEYYQLRAIFEPHEVRIDHVPGQLDKKKDGLARAFDAKLAAPTYLFVRGDDRTPDKNRVIKPGVPDVLGRMPDVMPVTLPRGASAPEKRAFVVRETLNAAQQLVEKANASVSRSIQQGGLGFPRLLDPSVAGRTSVAFLLTQTLIDLQLGRADVDVAEAKLNALKKVLAAERLEDEGKKESESWKEAAKAARAAQLTADHAEAIQKLRTQEQLARKATAAEAKKAEDKVVDARRAVESAQEKLKEGPSTHYVNRFLTSYPAESTGRRLAFARWLADKNNPLTARVAVNHLWARHFGQGLVPTINDFGRNGRPPSHPALLDWLAAEFVERGWSMKAMHRLIVTSTTYRTASTPDSHNAAIDRDNKYLWHYPSRRLEAEAVRDSIFHVAGRLDTTVGGPDINYPLGLTVPRRSLYFRHAAEKQMELMLIFDTASVTECYERRQSIVPQQALALLNSELVLKHARILARTLAEQTKGDAARFTLNAWESVLSRPPTAEEQSECLNFLAEQTTRFQSAKFAGNDKGDGSQPAGDPALRARENLVHALLNHHEFVTIR